LLLVRHPKQLVLQLLLLVLDLVPLAHLLLR
jgi:hypothetical protein